MWDDLQGGVLLGTERFVEKLKPLLMEQVSTKEFPRKERLAARPNLAELFSGIQDRAARNERIYQAVRVHEYALREVADFLGLYYSTISVIAKHVWCREKIPKVKIWPRFSLCSQDRHTARPISSNQL